jgi:ketosteroid isomerase-like protein
VELDSVAAETTMDHGMQRIPPLGISRMTDLGSTVTRFFEFFSTHNLEQMANFLREDARLFFPKTQPLVGKERILKFFQILFRQYPELTFTIEHTIAQQEKVAVHWRNRGTTRKNEPYENEGVTLFFFEDGLVSLMSDFFKDTGKF